MFERTKVDNSQDMKTAAASIELDDGRRVAGKFRVPRSKTLADALNGPAQFMEFQPFDGEKELIAKSAIRSLRLISVPQGRSPEKLIADNDTFDPHQILGVAKGASRADVRAAFHQMSKTYHPDRYSNAELPTEVINYLDAMVRRINAAYEVLAEETARREAFARQRSEPVYTSRPMA